MKALSILAGLLFSLACLSSSAAACPGDDGDPQDPKSAFCPGDDGDPQDPKS